MVLLVRDITTSKAGLMPIKKIFYAWYQGALQGSEMDQTFLHITRRAKGSIWYSTKGNKHYKQGTQSLQLPGIIRPLPTRDHQEWAILPSRHLFLKLASKTDYINQYLHQESSWENSSPESAVTHPTPTSANTVISKTTHKKKNKNRTLNICNCYFF